MGCFFYFLFLKDWAIINDMQKGLIVHTLIVNSKGEILMLQRAEDEKVLPLFWDIPGGTLEDGEDPAMGAIRETKEETGIDISGIRLFFHTSNVDVAKNKQFVRLIFTAKLDTDSVVVNPSEHQKYAWVEPTKISSYKIVDYLQDCVDSYLELSTNPIN